MDEQPPSSLSQVQLEVLDCIAMGETKKSASEITGYPLNKIYDVMRRPEALIYLRTLHMEADSALILTADDRLEHLSTIVTDKCTSPRDQMQAIDMMNKMEGVYTQKIEADVSHTGGVMLIPMPESQDEWEQIAEQSQQELMDKTIDV